MKKSLGCLGVLMVTGLVGMLLNSGADAPSDSQAARETARVGGFVLPRAGSFRCTSGDEHRQLMQLMGNRDLEARARFIRERQSCVVMLDPEPLQVTGAEGIDYLEVAVPGEYRRWVVQRELVTVVDAPTAAPAS